jgi:hypothetical protein
MLSKYRKIYSSYGGDKKKASDEQVVIRNGMR